MTDPDTVWKPMLASLIDDLINAGHLHSETWIEAFADTPRHLFAPRIISTTSDGYRHVSGADPATRHEWLSMVYSDDSLVTQDKPHAAGHVLPSGQPLRVATSSSTMPSLMARMLEVLDVHDGQRVLEIGTGTGYNVALLAHRLGETNVVSIDLDAGLVSQARRSLADLGYHPTLVTGDGAIGAADHGPYDRIISTAAVPEIPPAWIKQLAAGGKILANLRGDLAGSNLCLLTKHSTDDEVIGPILPVGGHFMWLRPELDDPHRAHEHAPSLRRVTTIRTTTGVDPSDIRIDDGNFRFLLQLELHGARRLGTGQTFDPITHTETAAAIATTADGSRAEAFTRPEPDGTHRLTQSGPRRIWDTVEATHRLFEDLGQPTPDRFGVVANDSTQFVWFSDDDNWHRWPLPLV